MSHEVQENISSFIDDELDVNDREALISRLLENDDQKQIWSRYCAMGDAIKKTLPETVNHNLLQRIQFALESEPALLAPTPAYAEGSRSAESSKPSQSNVVELPKKNSHGSLFRPVIGFSIAASLTLAVVLAFQTNSEKEGFQQVAMTPNVNLPTLTPATTAATDFRDQEVKIASQTMTPSTKPSTRLSSTSSGTSSNVLSVPVIDLRPIDSDATFAEQSLMDDGRWTRITQVDGIPLANHFLSGKREAHVQYKFQKNDAPPLARSVVLEKISPE